MASFSVSTHVALLGLIGEVLLIVGVVSMAIAVVYFFTRLRNSGNRMAFLRIFAILSVFIVAGAPLFALADFGGTSDTITIGHGEVNVTASMLGNSTYTASDISFAFVENVHTGNLTISSKNYGTKSGDLDVGKFTLSNGAGADVVTNNATSVVVLLNSGLYLILGCNNTALLAQDFSSNVYRLPGYS